MRRLWTAATLAVLAGGCAGARARRAETAAEARPVVVQTGVFRQLGLLTPQWLLDPAEAGAQDVPLRVTRHTAVYEGGAYVGLDAVDAGETVRVVYTPQREGPGLVARIDVLRTSAPRQPLAPEGEPLPPEPSGPP